MNRSRTLLPRSLLCRFALLFHSLVSFRSHQRVLPLDLSLSLSLPLPCTTIFSSFSLSESPPDSTLEPYSPLLVVNESNSSSASSLSFLFHPRFFRPSKLFSRSYFVFNLYHTFMRPHNHESKKNPSDEQNHRDILLRSSSCSSPSPSFSPCFQVFPRPWWLRLSQSHRRAYSLLSNPLATFHYALLTLAFLPPTLVSSQLLIVSSFTFGSHPFRSSCELPPWRIDAAQVETSYLKQCSSLARKSSFQIPKLI